MKRNSLIVLVLLVSVEVGIGVNCFANGTAPTITCPGDITRDNELGECGAHVTWCAPEVTGTPTPTVTCSRSSGSWFPVGTTVVTCTATNDSGSASCSFTVTVEDNEAPEMTCPTPANPYSADVGKCFAELTFTWTVKENCLGDWVSLKMDGTELLEEMLEETWQDLVAKVTFPFPVGTTSVTLTVKDVHGNTAISSLDVTVEDNEPPACPVPANPYSTDPGTCYATLSFPATDNCGVASATYYVGGTEITFPHCFPVGTTTVDATATDIHGNTNTCAMDITVNDMEAPTAEFITAPPDSDNDPTPLITWSGTDNNGCTAPGDLEFCTKLDGAGWSGWSSATSVPIGPLSEGEHTFEVRGRDEAGNIGSTACHTWFVDLTPPAILLITPADRAEYPSRGKVLADWSAHDGESGLAFPIRATCEPGEPIDTEAAGENPFFVEVSDLAGNVARVDVIYRVGYFLKPAGSSDNEGFEGRTCFLDKCIAVGDTIGTEPLAASYELGEAIGIAVIVTDVDGNLVVDAVGTVTFVRVTFVGEEEKYDIIRFFVISYNEELGLYTIDTPTAADDWQLPVGYYDVWIGFEDGTSVRNRIEITQGVE